MFQGGSGSLLSVVGSDGRAAASDMNREGHDGSISGSGAGSASSVRTAPAMAGHRFAMSAKGGGLVTVAADGTVVPQTVLKAAFDKDIDGGRTEAQMELDDPSSIHDVAAAAI